MFNFLYKRLFINIDSFIQSQKITFNVLYSLIVDTETLFPKKTSLWDFNHEKSKRIYKLKEHKYNLKTKRRRA